MAIGLALDALLKGYVIEWLIDPERCRVGRPSSRASPSSCGEDCILEYSLYLIISPCLFIYSLYNLSHLQAQQPHRSFDHVSETAVSLFHLNIPISI